MSDSLVTVIIPIYNAERYLHETITSVLSQTYKNFELLLVNHNSTDKSISIIKSFEKNDKRIKVINLSINKGGPAYPRNIGIDNAKGNYIAFLDSDDVWLEDKLEKQLEVFTNNDVDIVHTLANTIDINSNKIGIFNNQKTFNKLKYFMKHLDILYLSNYININTSLIKNNFNIRFREDKYFVALEDWCFWIDNIYDGKKEYLIKEKLINYRVDLNSISDRGTDKSYRKAFYLYAVLFNEGKISLSRFMFNTVVNLVKIIIKRLK